MRKTQSNRPSGAESWPKISVLVCADGEKVCFDDLCASYRRCGEESDYRVKAKGTEVVDIAIRRADGRDMDVDCVEIRFTVPLLNFSKVILPDSGREYLFKDRALFLRSQVSQISARNDGHPFVALVDQTGGLLYSFGLVSWLRESTCRCVDPQLSARNAMRGGHDLLTLSFCLPSEGWRYGKVRQIRETVFRKSLSGTWFHALRRYTDACKSHHRTVYPACRRALEPTWCTWTAWCSDRLSDPSVLENARIACELGVGSVILDDGWFGPGLDTDDRPLNIGDYAPDPAKFPNLPALVRSLHGLGLDVLLWYAPTCISPHSRAFCRLASHVMEWQGTKVLAPNGFYNLCPCHPGVRAYVRGEIARMLRDYGVDGFKVDLYNTLPATPCDAKHPHDCESVIEGLHRMMSDIWRTLRCRRPGGLLELKQNYGNVLSAQFGTMVRAGDTAYDVDTNLLRCAYIQAYAPVTHNDYLACSVHDSPRDIAVMMIKQMTGGVPTLSMDLTKQPEANLAVIRAWLEFYRSHLPLLSHRRVPLRPDLCLWQVNSREKAILSALFSTCEVPLPERDEVILLNGTGRENFYVRSTEKWAARATWCDHTLQIVRQGRIRVSDGTTLAVPVGGCVALRCP